VLLILSSGAAALVPLIYIGIALPAICSAKPARRKAAADLLRDVLLTPGPAVTVDKGSPARRGGYAIK
jgi:hypothetical protein